MNTPLDYHLVEFLKEGMLRITDKAMNPHLTVETIAERLIQSVRDTFNISQPTCRFPLFSNFHQDILQAYRSRSKNLTTEEQACVERILSKDHPNPTELIKFASCWFKHDPRTTQKWFAVDWVLGSHPKHYIHEAFSKKYQRHAEMIRKMHENMEADPSRVKIVMDRVFKQLGKELSLDPEEKASADPDKESDQEVEKWITTYVDTVPKEQVLLLIEERKSKALQSSSKRKKTHNEPLSS